MKMVICEKDIQNVIKALEETGNRLEKWSKEGIQTKTCKTCCKTLPIENFYYHKGRLYYQCKKCKNKKNNEINKKRYRTDPEFRQRLKEYSKNYAKLNKKSICIKMKERYISDPKYREKKLISAKKSIKKRNQRYNNLSDEEQQKLLNDRIQELLKESRHKVFKE